MKEPNFIAGGQCLDFVSTVEAIVKRSCIIDYGIIQNIQASGVVDVAVAVANTEQNMFCMTCVLANIASSNFTIDVKPSVGDRVLVVYPRLYDEKMFTVPDGDAKTELIINKQAKGYNLLSGIAILLNQYKKSSHKNLVSIDGDKVEIKLGYDKDADKYMASLTSTPDGIEFTDKAGNSIQSAHGDSEDYIMINNHLKVKK